MALAPTPEQLAALAARQADAPVVMINLLQFKADGGRESYLRYTREVAPHLSTSRRNRPIHRRIAQCGHR
jgi:hypothetical protein